MGKTIYLVVPDDTILPNMSEFTPKENKFILTIGVECLLETNKKWLSLSEEEMDKKIRVEKEKLERELLLERESSKRLIEELKKYYEEEYSQKIGEKLKIYEMQIELLKQSRQFTQQEIYENAKREMEEVRLQLEKELLVSKDMCKKIEEMYENQVRQLKKTNDLLLDKVKEYEVENRISLDEEVNKIKELYEVQLREKEKQVNKLSENYEKIHETLLIQKSKNVVKGIEGEKKFRDYALTFQDFKGFELRDKHTQSGEGDFHMHFEEMDILVDAKNYKNGVPSKEREKIKNDLLKNEHLHFAWLVSLNTSIDKYDRCPIMSEWIGSEKCIIYINHLLHYEDPRKILRIAWFYCLDLMKFMENGKEESKWGEVKERQFKIIERIKGTRKQIRELNTTIGQFKKQVDMIDNELRDLLNYESEEVLVNPYSLLDDWWSKNIEIGKEEEKLISTDIWQRFKHENKEVVKEFDLSIEKFKDFIKSKVPMTHLLMRSGIKGAIDIKGIRMK